MRVSMPVDIILSGDLSLGLIDEINQASATPLIYYTSGFLRFLLAVAPDVRFSNLVAMKGDRAVGFLPLLVQHQHGRVVVNSLPFYGSHGGPCVRADLADLQAVRAALLHAAFEHARASKAASLTIIENALDPLDDAAIGEVDLDVLDDRIGQFTRLPKAVKSTEDILAIFHQKTRNAVRKGYLSNQVVREVTDIASLQWLQQVHADAIGKLGGLAKGMAVFEKLVEHLPLGQSSRLFIGHVDGQPVSGVLVLLFGRTVEYFTPVVTEEFKNEQVLSALIVEVMRHLIAEGYNLWNWGGTWRSQEGVYRFKSRFGATDHPYRYVGKVFDEQGLRHIKSEHPSAFPYFYLYRY